METQRKSEAPATHPVNVVISCVARYYALDPQMLVGRSRSQVVAHARHTAMWILRDLFGWSFEEIGKLIGFRDHSTVMYGCDKIARHIKAQNPIGQGAIHLRARLEAITRRQSAVA